MAFQLKNFLSLVASMINHMRGASPELTDFSVGSVNRALIEAVAVEMDTIYQEMFIGLREAIPVAIYNSFNFQPLAAASAFTDVTFTALPVPTVQLVIPAGTRVRVPNTAREYLTVADAVLAIGASTVVARVVSVTVGNAGNTPASTITEIVSPIATITVTNLRNVVSGRDAETTDQRRNRFREFLAALSRGPLVALEYGAKTAFIRNASGDIVEAVVRARAVEPYIANPLLPVGRVEVYIYNGFGNTSVQLIARTQAIINGFTLPSGVRVMGWKAAGIPCTVLGVNEQALPVTGVVTPKPGFIAADLAVPVSDVLEAYIAGLDIGETFVRAEAVARAMAIPGVYNFNLLAPLADVIVTEITKSVPGVIEIS